LAHDDGRSSRERCPRTISDEPDLVDGHHGDGVVDVAVPLAPEGAVRVVGVLTAPVGEVDVLVGVGTVVVLLVVVDVVVDEVLVTVVVGVIVVDVVVVTLGLDFFVALAELPKNVVGWPLPVTERPATSSGTVNTTTTIAKASRPVANTSRHRGRQGVCASPPRRSRAWDCATSGIAAVAVWSGSS
jgi:hypothetical protein